MNATTGVHCWDRQRGTLVDHRSAQQPARPVIGYLSSSSLALTRDLLAAFRSGLAEIGYFEDENLAIEYRWAEDHYDRLPELAAELVRRQVAVIVIPGSTPGALALKKATQTIPIVCLIGTDFGPAWLQASIVQAVISRALGCSILRSQPNALSCCTN